MNKNLLDHFGDSAIAVIGMAGRFPDAKDIDGFWENLRNGKESVSFFSDEELLASGVSTELMKLPNYVRAKAVLSDIEYFDAQFFGFNPREAEITDVQHRIFLECAWEALENAGYAPDHYTESVGVYAGADMSTYFLNNISANLSELGTVGNYQILIGNDKDFLCTLVSYKLNLKGPSVTIQTACSTSLVAIHTACQSLLNGECDMALAGGVSVYVPHKSGYLYEEGMILSPDGHCRAFDAGADGTTGGSGCAIVLLKRFEDALSDQDCIHAVIRGSAVNNDGSFKVGFTAPGVKGQTDVITEAQALAGTDPETVTYIEAHGTGTKLGDPIEIEALSAAFHSVSRKNFCAVGSLKTNIGHLNSAAGAASFIKTVLALKNKEIPPSLNFKTPNPGIDFANSPFYVNTRLTQWKTENGLPRRAGVSSFGIGGTNAHVILEEAPEYRNLESQKSKRQWHLLILSAKTGSALDAATTNLADFLNREHSPDLADAAYTLQAGRNAFEYRRMLVCRDKEDGAASLNPPDPKRVFTNFCESGERPVAFMFSGQGAQYVNMGRELYETEPAFRKPVDLCSEILTSHMGMDLREILYPGDSQPASIQHQASSIKNQASSIQQLNQTAVAQPALFVVEYALAALWAEWGIRPAAMIGHSIGEYTAACLAGVFSLEDALSLVAARGQMMQELPKGSMLTVPLSEKEVIPLLDKEISLAAVNAPSLCVASGQTDAITALEERLAQQHIECRRLHTSHAFHSDMTEPILEAFANHVRRIRLNPPKIPYISNVTGTWINASEATDPAYWAAHLRKTVRFADGIRALMHGTEQILLEAGPGRTLSTFAMAHQKKAGEQTVLTSLRHPRDQYSDTEFLLTNLGKLWLAGATPDWNGFHSHESRYRVPLPTYPFERQRYWIDPPEVRYSVSERAESEKTAYRSRTSYTRPNISVAYADPRNETEGMIIEIFQELLGIEQIGIYDNFFDLGGHSLLATRGASRIREKFQLELSVSSLFEEPTAEGLARYIEHLLTLQKLQTPPDTEFGDRTEGEI